MGRGTNLCRCGGRTTRISAWRCAVYRYYDEDGQLLYVGSSIDSNHRWEQHVREGATWTERAVSRTDEWYMTEEEARVAEQTAIENEKPDTNKIRFKTRYFPATEGGYPGSDGWGA